MEQFDVIIVGAGMSGIQSAYYLQRDCPDRSFVLLEARQDLGGTWDLFKYPGVRSDSYMSVYGYSFNQWQGVDQLASGADIKQYLEQTANNNNISQQIRYNHNVIAIEWKNNKWYVTLENQPTIACQFIMMCSGYFDYNNPHTPTIKGSDQYLGTIVHPQQWQDLDYTNKDITIIGSGATMVTLAPELAKQATSVTVIQRSPGYIVNSPKQHNSSRYKKIWEGFNSFRHIRTNPTKYTNMLVRHGYDKPSYNPWEQRLCVTIDNEFFNCVDSGRIQLLTSTIDGYVNNGIKLSSGQVVPSDIVVTATGLNVKLLGGITITVNGTLIDICDTVFYRGTMFTGIPNFSMVLGYVNQSYTLRCELIIQYVMRILTYMKKKNLSTCTPCVSEKDSIPLEFPLHSNYLVRSKNQFPKKTWRHYQNYYKDWFIFKFCDIKKGMKFND